MPKNRKMQNIIGTEHITDAAEAAIAAQASGGATVAFKNVAVSGQDNVVADAATDTLTLVGGSNVTITTDASADSVTITSSDTQLSTEQVQDIVGAMFTGNTETNITATYEDSDGTIDLVASSGGTNDFDMQITQSGVIAGNQRFMLNKIPGWGSHGNSWQTRSNQDNPLFRPFIAPHTGNITEIGINCSTADSTGNTKITLAIYSDNDGVPHTKLGAVDIPCTSTGAQYVTSGFGTISLTRGTQYWWGFCRNNQTNTVGVRSMSQSDHIWIGPWNAITNVENYQVSLRLNSSANTMPSTITPGDLQGFYNNTCMCGIKIG